MSEIEVGGKVLLDLNGIPDKLHSSFVGYVKNRYVIIMMPSTLDVNRSNLLEYMYKGNFITVRFIKQGTVLGFKTTVTYFTFTPIPLLFLQYPCNFESYNLRKDDRVDCLFPNTVIINDREMSGALSDISKSGCNILLPIQDDQPCNVEVNDIVHFRCPMLFSDPQTEVSGVVKRVNKNGIKMELGLKFGTIGNDQALRIKKYIEQARYLMDA